MKYLWNTVLYLFCILVFVACVNGGIVETQPPEIESDGIRFVFITKHEDQLGGMPTLLENFYLGQDGFVQHSLESNSDQLFFLQEGYLETSTIIDQIGVLLAQYPEDCNAAEVAVATEYYQATISFEIGRSDVVRRIVFPVDELPQDIRDALDAIKSQVKNLSNEQELLGEQFVRAQRLSETKSMQLQEAGILIDVGDSLDRYPIVQSAIHNERRLIGVVTTDDLIQNRSPGSSVNILTEFGCFQIRILFH